MCDDAFSGHEALLTAPVQQLCFSGAALLDVLLILAASPAGKGWVLDLLIAQSDSLYMPHPDWEKQSQWHFVGFLHCRQGPGPEP